MTICEIIFIKTIRSRILFEQISSNSKICSTTFSALNYYLDEHNHAYNNTYKRVWLVYDWGMLRGVC